MAGSLQSKDHLDHNFAHLHTDPGCGTGSPLHADVMAGYSYGGHKAFPVGGDKKGKRPSSRAFCAAGGYVLTGNKAFAFIRQDQHSERDIVLCYLYLPPLLAPLVSLLPFLTWPPSHIQVKSYASWQGFQVLVATS